MALQPIFQSKTNHPLRLFCVGHEPKRYDWPEAKGDLIRLLGEEPGNAMLVVLASTSADEGFRTPKQAVFNSAIFADGVIYEGSESATFLLQTADCPLLVVQDEETGKVVIGHCGKYAMQGSNGFCNNMVTTVLSHFKEVDPVHLSAYIMAGICGTCYTHEQDLSHTAHFYGSFNYGENRELGELNLIKRIKHELRHEGILERNIEIDGRCTKENLELSSYRRGDLSLNTIIVKVN